MRRKLIGLALALGLIAAGGNVGWGADGPKPLPPFAKIKKAVEEYFQKRPNYQPGGIISQGEVAGVLAELAEMGFSVPDRAEILSDVPGDGESLVVALRTPAGRKFMRRIAVLPNAYDRLDRLMRLPHGEQTVHDLIRGPGGDELIKYLTATRGGASMGKLLSHSSGAADFNKPTGRIYTVAALVDRLQKSYAAASQRASGTAK